MAARSGGSPRTAPLTMTVRENVSVDPTNLRPDPARTRSPPLQLDPRFAGRRLV